MANHIHLVSRNVRLRNVGLTSTRSAIAGVKTPFTISPSLYRQTSKWLTTYDKPFATPCVLSLNVIFVPLGLSLRFGKAPLNHICDQYKFVQYMITYLFHTPRIGANQTRIKYAATYIVQNHICDTFERIFDTFTNFWCVPLGTRPKI